MVVRRYCIEIHGVCDPLCLQTQLTAAQQRIRDLEAELAHSKLEISMQSHSMPAGPCPKCRSLEVSYREVLSQVSGLGSFSRSRFPEGLHDYHNVRSRAFANLCAGSPSKVGCVFFVMLQVVAFSLALSYCNQLFGWPNPVPTVHQVDCMTKLLACNWQCCTWLSYSP